MDQTTPDYISLARRATACKAWMPIAGMLSLPDERGRWFRVVDKSAGAPPAYLQSVQVGGPVLRQPAPAPDALLPDLEDHATLGALLWLVREAWGDERISANYLAGYDSYQWVCVVDGEDENRRWVDDASGTEAGALVAALEQAP